MKRLLLTLAVAASLLVGGASPALARPLGDTAHTGYDFTGTGPNGSDTCHLDARISWFNGYYAEGDWECGDQETITLYQIDVERKKADGTFVVVKSLNVQTTVTNRNLHRRAPTGTDKYTDLLESNHFRACVEARVKFQGEGLARDRVRRCSPTI